MTMIVLTLVALLPFLFLPSAAGFVSPANGGSHWNWSLGESSKDGGGYKFGDISKFLAQKASGYSFGDISRYLDGKAKERIQRVKGDAGEYKYEFGDLSKWAVNLAQEKAAKYAGKENAEDYQLGDISRTVIKKVQSGEYSASDVYLALRVLLTGGFSVMPVAHLLPVQALLSLVELGLARDIGARLLEVLATSVDARMKEALTGNANYQLGDITKDRLQRALTSFTGKESYEFGDILRAVQGRKDGKDSDSSRKQLSLEKDVLSELQKWDEQFLKQHSSDLERRLPKGSS